MTIETKCVIDPEDILAVRFECAKCHASISVPIKGGLSEYATRTAAAACNFCHTPWEITPNSAEHKALLQFALGLETIAANMKGRPLQLRLEVKGADSTMSHIDDLEAVIHKLHGAKATHRESVPVKEVFQGETVWDGIVEVFHLEGHPKANTAYAWLHDTGDPAKPIQRVTVLHIPPVVSPITAVRAFIAQEFRNANAQA